MSEQIRIWAIKYESRNSISEDYKPTFQLCLDLPTLEKELFDLRQEQKNLPESLRSIEVVTLVEGEE